MESVPWANCDSFTEQVLGSQRSCASTNANTVTGRPLLTGSTQQPTTTTHTAWIIYHYRPTHTHHSPWNTLEVLRLCERWTPGKETPKLPSWSPFQYQVEPHNWQEVSSRANLHRAVAVPHVTVTRHLALQRLALGLGWIRHQFYHMIPSHCVRGERSA